MTTYHYLGNLVCNGSVVIDDQLNGLDGFGNATDKYYGYMYMEHGQTVNFDLHVRIHQPTVDFNNNTEAIWSVTYFGINLDGTESGDHGDLNIYRTASFTNSGPPPYSNSFSPGRWTYFEMAATFGATEFSLSATCAHLTSTAPTPTFITAPSDVVHAQGGGWNVGHA